MEAVTQQVQDIIKEAQVTQAQYTDEKRWDIEFQIKEKVLLSTKHLTLTNAGPKKKFGPRYIGPYLILTSVICQISKMWNNPYKLVCD